MSFRKITPQKQTIDFEDFDIITKDVIIREYIKQFEKRDFPSLLDELGKDKSFSKAEIKNAYEDNCLSTIAYYDVGLRRYLNIDDGSKLIKK